MIAEEIIDQYTDADALADDLLIDLSPLKLTFRGKPINRITAGLWADFQPFFPIIGRELEADEDDFDLKAFANCIRTKCRIVAPTARGSIIVLPPKIWLVENEVGGWTLMHPGEY
jgi:hypothetical protein